ncbi:uncharacterized protein LOC109256512 [Panthera pardus]|uniref:Uncharacterized protein LOC109256512 n=1 Tax=Panthera pardus TaxID=9691 RepID=A0A9W2USW3_PANPR|nr:uncharacterized protein LOC109256512 [Panthera pardus]
MVTDMDEKSTLEPRASRCVIHVCVQDTALTTPQVCRPLWHTCSGLGGGGGGGGGERGGAAAAAAVADAAAASAGSDDVPPLGRPPRRRGRCSGPGGGRGGAVAFAAAANAVSAGKRCICARPSPDLPGPSPAGRCCRRHEEPLQPRPPGGEGGAPAPEQQPSPPLLPLRPGSDVVPPGCPPRCTARDPRAAAGAAAVKRQLNRRKQLVNQTVGRAEKTEVLSEDLLQLEAVCCTLPARRRLMLFPTHSTGAVLSRMCSGEKRQELRKQKSSVKICYSSPTAHTVRTPLSGLSATPCVLPAAAPDAPEAWGKKQGAPQPGDLPGAPPKRSSNASVSTCTYIPQVQSRFLKVEKKTKKKTLVGAQNPVVGLAGVGRD